MSNPKVQVGLKSTQPKQAESTKQAPPGTFSDEEIRIRAYQIYESSDRTNKHADEDWSQAQAELTELLGGK